MFRFRVLAQSFYLESSFALICSPGGSGVLSRVQLCDPMDRSPPGSSVHGVLQARILEWVAISSSKFAHLIPTFSLLFA